MGIRIFLFLYLGILRYANLISNYFLFERKIMRYLADLEKEQNIVDFYFVKSKKEFKTQSGKLYFALELQDKTAVLNARIWDINEYIGEFEEGEVIKIDAIAQVYNDNMQLKINRARRAREGEYSMSDYIPSTKKNLETMYSELLEIINEVENPFLSELLNKILILNPVISKNIKIHSAAKAAHHAFLGGLLEHTLSVARLVKFLSGEYENVNEDLLVTAALLHDIAKIYELSPMPSNVYTDDGNLLGHIYMGAELIAKTTPEIKDFPSELENLLKHCILSHHGEYEFGSPKLPATIEACLLHHADNLDAKTKAYEESLNSYKGSEKWVGYHKLLGLHIRKTMF